MSLIKNRIKRLEGKQDTWDKCRCESHPHCVVEYDYEEADDWFRESFPLPRPELCPRCGKKPKHRIRVEFEKAE